MALVGSDYSLWGHKEAVETFHNKTVEDFFRTEHYFLQEIGSSVSSVLDVGCASGRFRELIRQYNAAASYTGLDIIEENILLARQNYPDCDFCLGNALELSLGRTFDLVNATGVIQHEPRYDALIHKMLEMSNRYCLFDVKLSNIPDHIANKKQSYCQLSEDRLNFNVFSLSKFLEFLNSLPGVSSIKILGYETKPNKYTHLPPQIERLVSAGILLETGSPSAELPKLHIEELPDWLV